MMAWAIIAAFAIGFVCLLVCIGAGNFDENNGIKDNEL